MKQTDRLLQTFVGSFVFNEDVDGFVKSVEPEPSYLAILNEQLPCRFPRLFEKLLLHYRWQNALISQIQMVSNETPDLSGFHGGMVADKNISDVLHKNRHLNFGRILDRYDPVCFDCNIRPAPVVVLDHEQILCNQRIKTITKVAASFDDLILSQLKP